MSNKNKWSIALAVGLVEGWLIYMGLDSSPEAIGVVPITIFTLITVVATSGFIRWAVE
jgi:hypothetical protein